MNNGEKKKIRIKIAGNVFTVLSSEDDDRTYAMAETVDRRIKEICRTARTSVTGAAMLSALNYCDELNTMERDTLSLKKQLSAYLEEIKKLGDENETLRAEIVRLRADAEIYRRRLREQSSPSYEPVSAPARPVRRALSSSESEEAAEEENNE